MLTLSAAIAKDFARSPTIHLVSSILHSEWDSRVQLVSLSDIQSQDLPTTDVKMHPCIHTLYEMVSNFESLPTSTYKTQLPWNDLQHHAFVTVPVVVILYYLGTNGKERSLHKSNTDWILLFFLVYLFIWPIVSDNTLFYIFVPSLHAAVLELLTFSKQLFNKHTFFSRISLKVGYSVHTW